jgi:Methane oxygenase PmoA
VSGEPSAGAPSASLRVGDTVVAEYVTEPQVDPLHGPRPFLHPVRTLAGVPVTDALPEDHRWHLGVSVCMQDVEGTNLWGGRTYVRGQGYTWLDDHGRIEHDGWLDRTPDRLSHRLRWLDRDGGTLLVEERSIAAVAVDERAWLLDFGYELRNPNDHPVRLGSPATNGRPDGAGYGGFFWRARSAETPGVFTADAEGEERVSGSAAAWVVLSGTDGAARYTIGCAGLGEGDRWFVRAAQYPGICVALAFDRVRTVEPDAALSRRHRVLVADGALDRDQVSGCPPVRG